MNTFFNIFQECSAKMILRAYGTPYGLYVSLCEQRQRMITAASIRLSLHRRIYLRGKLEQYQQRYLPNYYGAKRKARGFVLTVNTMP